MVTTLRVLIKFLVIPFYRVNLDFFLFWFFIFYGIISPTSVVQIHQAAIEAQIFTLPINIGAIFFWSLYSLKCLLYAQRYLINYKISFTYIFQALDNKYQYLILGCCFLLMHLPIIIYASVVFSVALYFETYLSAINILIFLVGSIIYCTYKLRKSVISHAETLPRTYLKKVSRLKNNRTLTVNLLFFIPLYLWKKRNTSLVLLKGISLGILYIFLSNIYEELSIDYLTIFLLIISFFNALIAFFVQQFNETQLSFFRNLPLTFTKRYLLFFCTGVILFVPELVYMIIYGFDDLSIWQIVGFYFLFVSQFILCISLAYTPYPKGDAKKFLKLLFTIFLLVTIIFMFFGILILIIASISLSIILLRIFYHKYEFSI